MKTFEYKVIEGEKKKFFAIFSKAKNKWGKDKRNVLSRKETFNFSVH